jgi:hypothetical protein
MGWIIVNGKNVYKQEKGSNCGPACAVMVIRLMTGKQFSTSYVETAFGSEEGSVHMSRDGRREFENTGSVGGILGTILGRYTGKPWRNMKNPQYLKKYMELAKANEPAVLGVSWNNAWNGNSWEDISDENAGHWIVLSGKIGDNYQILDPGGIASTLPTAKYSGPYFVGYPNDDGTKNWISGEIDSIVTYK